MKPTTLLSSIGSLLLLAGGIGGFFLLSEGAPTAATRADPGPEGPLVETATARIADAPPLIHQTGFLQADRIVDVAFEVQGRISDVAEDFAVGNAVAPGVVLARIDTERLRSALARAEADLTAAEARLEEARAAFRRQSELQQSGVTAEAALDEVQTARDTAEAQVAVAEAGVEAARIDLAASEVRAPFEAFVIDRTASEGQLVTPGQPIGRLVRADLARVVVGLSDRQVAALGDVARLVGQEVTLRRAGAGEGPLRTGKVVDIDAQIDRATRTTNLIVAVPDPFGDAPIRLGELLSVAIPMTTPEPLIAVPVDAVKDGRRVWTVENGRLRPRPVTVVLRTDDEAYLSDAGALDGARLMTTDLGGAAEGTRVRVAGDDRAGDE